MRTGFCLRCGRLILLGLFAAYVGIGFGRGAAAPIDSSAVKKLLAHPPREYATAPLWVWNDDLTEEQIRETLRDLASQGVKQAFVHPRPGLMTPYLGGDWFRLWKSAVDEAAKLDMNIWIYDENSYPSGFAGGWVPEVMPESRGMGLVLRASKAVPVWATNLVAVFAWEEANRAFGNISGAIKAGEKLGEGDYLIAAVQRAGNSPWHGNRSYVNLLTPGVTEKFIELTLERYRRELGGEFGKRVPGVFTDEPNIRPAGGLPWCEDLPGRFQRRWGYNLVDRLASLARETGDWRRVRHNYYYVLNELFIERWAQPYYRYCATNGLQFTGHYWDHEWPNCGGVPDNMAMYAWHQRPAIDCLMNQYQEQTHAQFGNIRMCRELLSVANQLGLKRTLCEVYGAGGWDLRFEDMKRIGDWLAVLGVNTMDEHLSYITLRGARKRDHPQSFSYHEPWWEAYHVSALYLARLCAALSQGEQINRILVLEPTTTAWMYQGNAAKLNALGDSFFKLLRGLESAQIEYDLGCEDIIARHGKIEGNTLRIGQRAYPVVVIPELTENLNGETVGLGEDFLSAGGTVVCLGEPAAYVDGVASDRPQEGANSPGWISASVDRLPAILGPWSGSDEFALSRAAGDKGILFHMRRQIADGEILFLVNTSIEAPSSGTIRSSGKGVERLELNGGRVESYGFERTTAGLRASFTLPPSGSLLLFLSQNEVKPAPTRPLGSPQVIEASGPVTVRRLEPNVLVLDFVDISAGGETRSNVYFYQANQFAWQKNGFDRNPWDSAVQFKDELISKKFPAESGFSATYKFTIDSVVPGHLELVLERPDLYAITCNGRVVTAKPGSWWLDKAFGRIDLAVVARPGENTVTIRARPFTMLHELEPAYLLGDFSLKAAERGFIVTSDRLLQLMESRADGGWNGQGHPFYASGVAYRQTFQIQGLAGTYTVALPQWYGSVAKVIVNGQTAGYITAPPWECQVTAHLKPGSNTIEVVVIGTLKNTLGPHHGNPGLGSAWPGMFQRGPSPGPPPGAQYATVSYGLFAPFVVRRLE